MIIYLFILQNENLPIYLKYCDTFTPHQNLNFILLPVDI